MTVANVLSTSPLTISFRRALVGDRLSQWLDLVVSVMNINLNKQNDRFVWSLKNTSFTVKSMYSGLMCADNVPLSSISWKLKIPIKIRIFLWYLKKDVILTKDNLVKRKWKGGTKRCFCNSNETIQHLFFNYHLARFIWNVIHVFNHL